MGTIIDWKIFLPLNKLDVDFWIDINVQVSYHIHSLYIEVISIKLIPLFDKNHIEDPSCIFQYDPNDNNQDDLINSKYWVLDVYSTQKHLQTIEISISF